MTDYQIRNLLICEIGADAARVEEVVKSADLVVARGEQALRWLDLIDINIDHVIKVQTQFDRGEDAQGLRFGETEFQLFQNAKSLCYVTQITPPCADLVAAEFIRHAEMVRILGGQDPVTVLFQEHQVPVNGRLQIVDGLTIVEDQYPQFSSAAPALVHLDGSGVDMAKFKHCLLQVYPGDHLLYGLDPAYPERGGWVKMQVKELSGELSFETLYLPALPADSTLENFMHVIAKLRAPDGCPWDRKQTHASLRRYLLEETYEAIERLDENDLAGLQEELGDILLQIALHAEIAWESGTFDMTGVLQGINRKIVSRHPHVFSTAEARDETAVIQNWEKIKESERAENEDESQKGLLDGIPAILPALSQAQSLQERAARVGFDWPEIKPVINKVFEEFEEIKHAPDAPSRAEELGDLLFAVVNLVRWYGVDSENALRATNTKFRKRFAYIEKEARAAGRELRDMTLEEMDVLWEAAKKLAGGEPAR